MKILLCGWDGYIGFALAQNLLKRGHTVVGIDNYFRRAVVEGLGAKSVVPIATPNERKKALKELGDFKAHRLNIAQDGYRLKQIFKEVKPEAIANLAQQPSAAYSMASASRGANTVYNNVVGALNILWCMRDVVPESHLVTLGTMGEYGCPNMPIPEGFFKVTYKGMTDILPFPRQTNSVYHTSKVMTSDLAWFAARVWELRITDIMQGVVYGTHVIPENVALNTRFDIDECFGTMINRATACAVAEQPILVYGSGMQTRAYIDLRDSVECLTLMLERHPTDDDSIHGYRVVNQFDESYSCNEVAEFVRDIAAEFGLNTEIEHVPNPRVEPEVHFYEPEHEKLYMHGWKPKRTLKQAIEKAIEDLMPYKERIKELRQTIYPTILWRPEHTAIKRR